MNKTKYQTKRYEMGLSKEKMANLLGLSYVKYDSIEKGEVKMPLNLIDKFNEILKRGRFLNKLEESNDKKLIDDWFASMVEIKNGEPVIKEKMKEFNIPTYTALGKLLGYTSPSTLVNNINQPNKMNTPNLRARLYYFFNDEVNIQKPEKKVENLIKEIDELYEEKTEEVVETAEEVIEEQVEETIEEVVEETVEEVVEEVVEEKEDLTTKIINTYQEKIDRNLQNINNFESLLKKLRLENKIYDELIQFVKNEK